MAGRGSADNGGDDDDDDVKGRSATTNELLRRRSFRGSKFIDSRGDVGDLMEVGEARADLFGVGKGAREVGGCFKNSHEWTI